MRMWASRSLNLSAAACWPGRLLDALLPRRCVLCTGPCDGANLCRGCREDLPRLSAPCPRCALPQGAPSGRGCTRCKDRRLPWDDAFAALSYQYPVDALVGRFKFNRSFACGRALARQLADGLAAWTAPLPSAIVPVPLHRLRSAQRSFNQADLLAREVGRILGIPVRPGLLRRRRFTRAQRGLDARERRRNLHGAFVVPSRAASALAGAHIALLDDVMTTGATLAACCRALRCAGVRRISAWAVARAE